MPNFDASLISDAVEERMDLVRDVCSLGRFAREEAGIKVRQPISDLILPKSDEVIIGDLLPIIEEELNVKEVEFKEDMTEYLEYIVKPNFKVVGKTLGPKVKLLSEVLNNLTSDKIQKIQDEGLVVNLEGEDVTITDDMVLISLKQKEGYASSSNNRTCVVLNTELSHDLILEGLAREFVRKVQSLRKDADFVITDHINVTYHGSSMINEMLDKYYDYVMGEILGDKLVEDKSLSFDDKLNDEDVVIKVERV